MRNHFPTFFYRLCAIYLNGIKNGYNFFVEIWGGFVVGDQGTIVKRSSGNGWVGM
jgi:hypothetical protein